MDIARAIIAAVLATGLIIIAIIQELGDVDLNEETGANIDMTMLLLAAAVVVLILPDTINYFRAKKDSKPASKEDDA